MQKRTDLQPAPGAPARHGNEGKEFLFTQNDFERVRRLIYDRAGIALGDGKQEMVYSRLSRRLRLLHLGSFEAYLRVLEADAGGSEWEHFTNALTTNLTSFFREAHHFPVLAEHVRTQGGPIEIWCCASSTGEEPYSIAMTVTEALDTLRDLYGFDYTAQGNRITVLPASLQTRIFKVNYLQALRRGRTETRVSSGSITDGTSSPGTPAPGAIPVPTTGPTGAANTRATESSRVTTTSSSNFWGDIQNSLTAILGGATGRSVVVNPQSGVIVVRAMPNELRGVEQFLTAMQLIVERQVMLEAKIIEVRLRDGYQAGINWAGFRDGSTRFGAGVISPGTVLQREGSIGTATNRAADGTLRSDSVFSGGSTGGIANALALGAGAAGGLFGLALQTQDFAALLTFLETQGGVNVLSSPRVATINNQKAVLKVGTDDFFVTNVSTTSSTSGSSTTVTPTITVAPFFSGIALDVTPQIDDLDSVAINVRPTISRIIRYVNDPNPSLAAAGVVNPVPEVQTREMESIIKVPNQQIAVIGVPGQMNLHHPLRRHRRDVRVGVKPMVPARDEHVVHVQQQPTACAPHHFGDKCGFVPGRSDKFNIGGRVFQQHTPTQVRLYLVNVVAHPLQGGSVVRQWQQIVQKCVTVRRPGKMLGEGFRLVALEQDRKRIQMFNIQRRIGTNRQTHSVHR